MHRAREAHVHVQKATFMVADGLKLYRVEQLSVEVIGSKGSRGHNANVASINGPCHIAKSRGSCQLLEPSPNFWQLIPARKVDLLPENLLDAFAHPVDHIVACRAGNVEGLGTGTAAPQRPSPTRGRPAPGDGGPGYPA